MMLNKINESKQTNLHFGRTVRESLIPMHVQPKNNRMKIFLSKGGGREIVRESAPSDEWTMGHVSALGFFPLTENKGENKDIGKARVLDRHKLPISSRRSKFGPRMGKNIKICFV